MDQRLLGRTDLSVSSIGFGAFKIGRNEGIKYARGYDLPDEAAVRTLLHTLLDLGVTYVDTAPAYGLSEERVGAVLGARDDVVISTKVGETFEQGRSTYDFSTAAVEASVDRSRRRLRRDVLDLVLVHSDGRDREIIEATNVVTTLRRLRDAGAIRWLGFSGKTVEGADLALDWADAIMVEYHLDDCSHEGVIARAAEASVGIIVKKGLASGRLDAGESVRFVLANGHVDALVIGGLSADHFAENARTACEARPGP
jgi:aryl-alcohol dehydrogenase-like predicted oxidoreductase